MYIFGILPIKHTSEIALEMIWAKIVIHRINEGLFSRVWARPWLFSERGIGLLFSEFVVCKRYAD